MENNPDLEFEFFLAERLSKDLHEIRAMSNVEFQAWAIYYARKAQRQQLASMKGGGRRGR